MRTFLALCVAGTALAGCASDGFGDRHGYGRDDRGRHASRRQLRDGDRIYRDNEGRYYCKRDDGTKGTIVGALAGGVLGNVIAPGDSKTLGTILGAGAGAIAGRAIDRNEVHCD
jgi:outer membrane lipoprotein SlyB